jgi:hypothetical protein
LHKRARHGDCSLQAHHGEPAQWNFRPTYDARPLRFFPRPRSGGIDGRRRGLLRSPDGHR